MRDGRNSGPSRRTLGQADSCLLTRPPDRLPCAALLWPRRLLPAAPPANPAGGRAARSAFTQILTDTPGNVPLKAGADPAFPDDELAYGARSNVRIFAG